VKNRWWDWTLTLAVTFWPLLAYGTIIAWLVNTLLPNGASFTSPIPARSSHRQGDDRAGRKDNLQQSGGYMKTIYKAFGYDSRGDNRRTAFFAERSDAEKVSRELDASGRVVVGEIVLFESYDDWHNNQSARTE